MTDPANQEEAALAALQEALDRWQSQPPTTLKIGLLDAWVVLGCIQLAVRHPATGPSVVEHATRAGRAIQDAICNTAELRAIAETGWHESDWTLQRPPAGRQR
jgi:hypothetical protein